MPGTVIGGQRAAKTNKERYGEDFYKVQGKIGGKVKCAKGFGSTVVGKDGLSGKDRSRIAGKLGGSLSKIGVRQIPGFDKLYGVTKYGDVWAYPKTWVSGDGAKFSHDGKWLNRRPDKNGYLKVMLSKEGKLKHIAVHRLVAMTYIENPDQLPQVNHKDGVKVNNYVGNLEWCTNAQNQRYAFATGLRIPLRGSRHPMAKLTDEDVADIRMFAAKGISHNEIARVYPVGRQTIDRIVSGELWRETITKQI